jgi:hypothetical protein
MPSGLTIKAVHKDEAKNADRNNNCNNKDQGNALRFKIVHLAWMASNSEILFHFNQEDMISHDKQRTISVKTLLGKDPIAAPIVLSAALEKTLTKGKCDPRPQVRGRSKRLLRILPSCRMAGFNR